MSSSGDASGNPKTNRTLLLIVSLFLLPVLIASAMYWLSVRPDAAHHGNLLSPPLPLHFSPMLTWQDKPFAEQGLRGKWSLLYVASAPCNEPCMARVYLMRQVHAALGKDAGRVQRIMLATASPDGARFDAIQRDFPDLIILARPMEAVAHMTKQLAVPGKPGGGIYLIDPQGNAMMHYVDGSSPGGIHQDLQRLLKYSWAG